MLTLKILKVAMAVLLLANCAAVEGDDGRRSSPLPWLIGAAVSAGVVEGDDGGELIGVGLLGAAALAGMLKNGVLSEIGDSPLSEATNLRVRTTRMIAGNRQFAPERFAGYGILAFQSHLTYDNKDRHRLFCEAFLAGLNPVTSSTVPPARQAITVWPVNEVVTDEEYSGELGAVCFKAMQRYDIATARDAIELAVLSGREFQDRRGPFLIALRPGANVDASQLGRALLTLDLSDYDDPKAIQEAIIIWSANLANDTDTWGDIAIVNEEANQSLFTVLGQSADHLFKSSDAQK